MPIEIDHLDEAELLVLNQRVVARLKQLATLRAAHGMRHFAVGDRVMFEPPGQGPVFGRIVKLHIKDFTFRDDPAIKGGRQGRAAPSLLGRIVGAAPAAGLPGR